MVSIARDILTFHQNIEDRLSLLKKEPIHSFHLGVLYGQAGGIISQILSEFSNTHPQIEVSVTEAGSRAIKQMLLDNKIDIGILSGAPFSSSFQFVPLKNDIMILLTAKDSEFSKTHPCGSTVSFEELTDLQFVTKPQGTYSRLILDTLSQLYEIPLKIKYELENLSPFAPVLAQLNCATLLPESYYKSTPKLYTTMDYFYIDYSETHYQELICYRKNLFVSDYLTDLIKVIQNYRPVSALQRQNHLFP